MKKIISLSFFLLILTGCLYPDDKRLENQVSFQDQLTAVRHAVAQYRIETQLLPVHHRETEMNDYQQYLVDFHKLVPRYLPQAPGNSFENGGVYQYILLDVETNPQVKLIDLTITRRIQEFQRTINDYRRKNRFAPVKEVIDNGVFLLDYQKLSLKEAPTVSSPFHPDHRLPLLMDGNGTVIVDYTIDLNYGLQKFDHEFKYGDDIRSILIDNFPFVPAYSITYTIQDGKAVFFVD